MIEIFQGKFVDNSDKALQTIADHYVNCFDDMDGRAPGGGTISSIRLLARGSRWDEIPFNRSSGGCGGAMRSMILGLVFSGQEKV